MDEDSPPGWDEPVPADKVIDNLSENLQSMDNIQALELLEHLLVNSTVAEEEGVYFISYLTLSKKFLEIDRASKQIEYFYKQYFDRIDKNDVPPKAHPKKMEAMTVKKAKKKYLSEDLLLFYSLAQEVIVELSRRLTKKRVQDSNPLNFVGERISSKDASAIRDTFQKYDRVEEITNALSQPQREKYLYYTDKIGKKVHDHLVHIRKNLRNQLIHNLQERQTLDSFIDIEGDLEKCVGAINKLSLLIDDEVAIQVIKKDDGDYMITDS